MDLRWNSIRVLSGTFYLLVDTGAHDQYIWNGFHIAVDALSCTLFITKLALESFPVCGEMDVIFIGPLKSYVIQADLLQFRSAKALGSIHDVFLFQS